MPPSMSSSEALVIWMLRIAMNAPIMAALTAIQAVVLALSGVGAPAAGAPSNMVCVVVDIAPSCQPCWRNVRAPLVDAFRCRGDLGRRGLGVDGRVDRHAGPQHDGKRARLVEYDLHRDALHDLGEIAGGVV